MTDKQRMWILVIIFAVFLALCIVFISRKMFVYGGKEACLNTGGTLIEGFKCFIPIPDQTQQMLGNWTW